MRHRLLLLSALFVACTKDPKSTAFVTGARIAFPAAQGSTEWTLPARDYSNSRYSDLDDITSRNVRQLRAAWTFSTGVLRGHEGQPLVVDNTMYVITPYPNVAYALDLTQPGVPLKWKFRPENDQRAQGLACCDVVNRGASFADGKLVYNLLDGHTVAIDVTTGKQVWRTKMGDIERGETITMAPLIVKDMVIVGSSGGEMGVRGWVAALDLTSGKERWRAHNTGPDSDVKVTERFKPFYAHDRGTNIAATSWPTDGWKLGGGVVWGWISYDPDLNLIYYGTANPGPWNQDQRPGDNKWTCAIMARDADTGELRWVYQQTPHDLWDYDGVNENILVDLPLPGAGDSVRKALVHFDRNGFAYTLDRATGEVLVAQPFVPMNWSSGVDLKTGRPNVDSSKATKQDVLVKNICPSLEGGKNQQPSAFSPKTGLFYVPTINLCMDYQGRAVAYFPGTPYIGAVPTEYGGPGDYKGEFIAWDASSGKKIWGIKEQFPVWGGALATAGNVVFYGTLDGYFKAVDASTGEVLWQFKVGSGVVGNPITYRGPDGRQFIAVYAGVGGDMGYLVAGDVGSNLAYDVRERGTTLPDLARYTSWGGMLFVFSLDGAVGSR
jgi:PQQ-dependent dehydrogenase (methanol/ethanol family)